MKLRVKSLSEGLSEALSRPNRPRLLSLSFLLHMIIIHQSVLTGLIFRDIQIELLGLDYYLKASRVSLDIIM